MVRAKDAELLGDIVEIALRGERLFLKAQFEARTPAEVEWAQNGLRHARGLKKVALDMPAPTPATGPA